jgi:hypothetical protein
MHTQERKLPAAGKGRELPAERSYSVGLAKAIGEECDAKRGYQQVVSKPKLAGMLKSGMDILAIIHYRHAQRSAASGREQFPRLAFTAASSPACR